MFSQWHVCVKRRLMGLKESEQNISKMRIFIAFNDIWMRQGINTLLNSYIGFGFDVFI